ncbi:MAG: hypothetical protein ACXVB0_25170 [Mucilaginibacter sp.]
MKDNLTKEFLAGIKEVENILIRLHFYVYSFNENGAAYYIKYKKDDIIVEFLFGPSGWDVEMIILSNKGKLAFKDLLQIPSIALWVKNNRYRPVDGRNIKNELLWYVELFKIALPIVEQG